MRLVFDKDGRIRTFHKGHPVDPLPAAPLVTVETTTPEHIARAMCRAAARGRVSRKDGKVCLDGTAYVEPAAHTKMTYGEVLAAVDKARTVADLRAVLYILIDQALFDGVLEL